MSVELLATLALGLGWLLLAARPGSHPRRRARVLWPLVAAGIPLLGGLTLAGGPLVGVAGLALGALVLLRAPRGRRSPPLD